MTDISNLLPLPENLNKVKGLFCRPNESFVDELADSLKGKRVLEVFAGNGCLAALLARRGVDIVSTSEFSVADAHDWGFYFPVESMGAVQAVQRYGAESDVLLMSWPTVTCQAEQAANDWGDKPMVFIGERTDYSNGHLGGCATDEFHERFSASKTFESYVGGHMEVAQLGVFAPSTAQRNVFLNEDHFMRVRDWMKENANCTPYENGSVLMAHVLQRVRMGGELCVIEASYCGEQKKVHHAVLKLYDGRYADAYGIRYGDECIDKFTLVNGLDLFEDSQIRPWKQGDLIACPVSDELVDGLVTAYFESAAAQKDIDCLIERERLSYLG